MRWIAYTRVSTEEQAAGGHSLTEQEATLRAEVARMGDELVEVIPDAGFSGKSMERPGIKRALRAVAEGDADGIVCTKLDRLTRSLRDLQDVCDWFERNDFELKMLDATGIDTTSANGKAMLHMMGTFAQWWRDQIGERTRDVLRAPNSEARRKMHQGRPRVADGVTELIERLDRDGLNLSQIARELTERGIPTARGGTWHASTVRSVLYERRPAKPKPFQPPAVTARRRPPKRKRRAA